MKQSILMIVSFVIVVALGVVLIVSRDKDNEVAPAGVIQEALPQPAAPLILGSLNIEEEKPSPQAPSPIVKTESSPATSTAPATATVTPPAAPKISAPAAEPKTIETAPLSETVSPQPQAPSQPVSVTIIYSDSGYSPTSVTVKSGTTVIFKNTSSRSMWTASDNHPSHTLYPVSGGCGGSAFDACSGTLSGGSWSFTFDVLGTWGYHDHLNPSKGGTVTAGN